MNNKDFKSLGYYKVIIITALYEHDSEANFHHNILLNKRLIPLMRNISIKLGIILMCYMVRTVITYHVFLSSKKSLRYGSY